MASNNKSVANFVQSAEMPAHLQKAPGEAMGNENVSGADKTIAKLDLIQSLSPQIDEDDARFIEGAELGHIFDSVTGQLYDSVFLVNLYFQKTYPIFKKRKFGGGFEGSFSSQAEAAAHLSDNSLPADQYDIVETDVHACLMLDSAGTPVKPVLVYMSGSKQKVSRNWNTAIEEKGGDRFATVWVATSTKEKNRQGQPYQNFKIDYAGWASEDLYNAAKENYLGFRSHSGSAAA